MFDHLLASIRIGAAEVDTRLDRGVLRPGEEFSAQVVVKGGEVDQDVDGLELRLATTVGEDAERSGSTRIVDSWTVSEAFTVAAGEERVFPFEARLHPETPVTRVDARRNHAEVWIDTAMSIEMALDADDTDPLTVAPTPAMDATLSAIERCGFELREVRIEEEPVAPDGEPADLDCSTAFVFRPENRRESRYDGLSVYFVPRESRTDALLEFERSRADDVRRTMRLDGGDADVDAVARRFRECASGG